MHLPVPDGNNFILLQKYFISELKLYFAARARVISEAGRRKLSALRRIKGSADGRACFVFGNGPSLNLLDPQKVETFVEAGFDVFVVNNFLRTKRFRFRRNTSLVLSDPGSFDPDSLLLSIDEAQKITRLFVPQKMVEATRDVLGCPVYGFCDKQDSWIFSTNISPLRPRSYISMTAYKALAIAVYLGYDNIFICGFDNTYVKNFHVDSFNCVYRLDEHFDSDAYAQDGSRDYWPTRTYGAGSVSELLFGYARLFKDLHRFPSNKIINLDPNSLVDAFPKTHRLDIYLDDRE